MFFIHTYDVGNTSLVNLKTFTIWPYRMMRHYFCIMIECQCNRTIHLINLWALHVINYYKLMWKFVSSSFNVEVGKCVNGLVIVWFWSIKVMVQFRV